MKRLAFVLVGLSVLLGGCTLPGGGAREITAMLGDGAGLYVGNDVGVLGVPVGKVTAVEPAGKVVKVTMKVTDPDIRIPVDAAAIVVSRSVATDRYIELTPVYRGGAQMPSGSVIPLERTRTPVDFDQVLGSLSEIAEDLTETPEATNSISEVLQTVAAAFTGNSEDLNTAVHGLAGMVDTIHGQRTEFFGTMDALDELTTDLVDNRNLIEEFVENLGDALDLLNGERDEIGHVLRALQDTLEDLNEFSKENRDAVKVSVNEAAELLRTTMTNRKDLAETMEVMPLATDNVARALSPDNRIWVRTNLFQLTPLGPLIEELCQVIGPVCQQLKFPDIPGIGGVAP